MKVLSQSNILNVKKYEVTKLMKQTKRQKKRVKIMKR